MRISPIREILRSSMNVISTVGSGARVKAPRRSVIRTGLPLCGRRLLACPMSDHPDPELACDAIKMADGGTKTTDCVIFHTDRGSMERVESCFDNASRRPSSPPWTKRCSRGATSLRHEGGGLCPHHQSNLIFVRNI